MDVTDNAAQIQLEQRKLKLEYYKARLEYRKFVLGSVFVAIAIAAIPPLFQLATAFLEYVKSSQQLQVDKANKTADRETKQQEFRDDYIKEFLSNALNQDIELRIRFSEYFAFVSTDNFKQDWRGYHTELVRHRDDIRKQIDKMEAEWQQKAQAKDPDRLDIDRLERNLAWAYKEVGYVERNRSVAANPRAPDAKPVAGSPATTADGLIQLFDQLRGRKDDLQALLDAAAEFGMSDQNDVAIFLALVFDQSSFLTLDVETLNYSPERLMLLWPARIGDLQKAQLYAHQPEALANYVYGGRMGNTEPGDGYKFRGRGYLQITGRQAYHDIGQALGIDSQLEQDPDKLIRDPKLNARAAASYYTRATALLRGQVTMDPRQALRALTGGLFELSNVTAIYNRIRAPS
jgi:predicted chitinase